MKHPRTYYREASVRGATSVELVVLLYEQVIQDLGRAARAIDEHDIEGRTGQINHALSVIAHLRGTLNLELGGQVARHLDRFYEILVNDILLASMQGSKEVLVKQIDFLLMLREAWVKVALDQGVATLRTGVSQTGAALAAD